MLVEALFIIAKGGNSHPWYTQIVEYNLGLKRNNISVYTLQLGRTLKT